MPRRSETASGPSRAAAIAAVVAVAFFPSAPAAGGENALPEKSLPEKILSLPGLIVEFPLEMVLDGASATIGWARENRVVPRTIDLLTSDDWRTGLRPAWESRGGAGLRLFHRGIAGAGSKLEISALWWTRRRQGYEIALERIRLGEAAYVDLSVGYGMEPDEAFHGIGPRTEKGDETDFALESLSFEVDLGAALAGWLDLEAFAAVERCNVLAGRDPDIPGAAEVFSASLPGLETDIRLAGAGARLVMNGVRREGREVRGWFFLAEGGVTADAGEGRYGWWRARATGERHLHIAFGRRLVFRCTAEAREPFDDREIPFFRLSEIGSRETMRGFERGRFRDRDMICGSIEYHWPVWEHRGSGLDTFLFFDAGQVAGNLFGDLRMETTQGSGGVGVVLRDRSGPLARIEIGRSRDWTSVSFLLR